MKKIFLILILIVNNKLLFSQNTIDSLSIKKNNQLVNYTRIKADSNFYTGRYDRAISFYDKILNNLDGQGLYNFAECYLAKNDYLNTSKYYQMAMDKNYAEAYYGKGYMYFSGIGEELSYSNAIKYFEKSSELGYIQANEELGYIYINGGNGVIKNINKAIEYYYKNIEKKQNRKYKCNC